MMLFVKDASGLSKSTNKLDGILLSCHCTGRPSSRLEKANDEFMNASRVV